MRHFEGKLLNMPWTPGATHSSFIVYHVHGTQMKRDSRTERDRERGANLKWGVSLRARLSGWDRCGRGSSGRPAEPDRCSLGVGRPPPPYQTGSRRPPPSSSGPSWQLEGDSGEREQCRRGRRGQTGGGEGEQRVSINCLAEPSASYLLTCTHNYIMKPHLVVTL